ncbi:MAG TPA: helix-turn-helix domain-containing protein [Gemmatimonadaceae bacterium]|jgi:DNA-binding HxlR family transcriptional regulator|nr:helix-turn-helix domain-containing protein [Gemmatimonadaceae bacterium]
MSDAVNLCPRFHVAVELVGGRWTGAIINRLLAGRARYNELRAAIPEISDRMLSERLRVLETEGVVTRTVVPESPVRVEYELTAKGRALEEALEAIGKWATRWISEEDLARSGGSTTPEASRRQTAPARPANAKRRPRASVRKRS